MDIIFFLLFLFIYLFIFDVGPFLKSLLYLLQYCFFYYVLLLRPGGHGILAPDQESNLHPALGRQSLNQ